MTRPLVSVLIPAYNERHFAAALASALVQTYAPVEVVVCDDSPGTAIGEEVKRSADARVRYVRNPQRLGFGANFTQCFALARGELVKFLNDDDVLRPQCVEALAAALIANPGISLATSRRVVIDAHGRQMPDVAATTPIAYVSAIMSGAELGNFVLMNSTNYIGEPSTALFRRSQVDLEDGALFRWGGRDYHCLADLSLWLRLLAKGLGYYAAAPLSEYRMHGGQEQDREDVRISCLVERMWIVRQAREAGFLAAPALLHAALASLRSRAALFLQAGGLEPGARATVAGLLAELDAEVAAASRGAPR